MPSVRRAVYKSSNAADAKTAATRSRSTPPGRWRFSVKARQMRHWISVLAIMIASSWLLVLLTLGIFYPFFLVVNLIGVPALIALSAIYAVKRNK